MQVDTRKKLHQQIDSLPDSAIELIQKFTEALIANQKSLEYCDWDLGQWQKFSLAEFFREDDEIEYFLEDAREIYKS